MDGYYLHKSKTGLWLTWICLTLYFGLCTFGTADGKFLAAGQPGVCTTVIKRNESYSTSFLATAIIRKTHACGVWNWGTCSYYTLEPRFFYRTQYRVVAAHGYVCCSGWEEIDGECLIIPEMDSSSDHMSSDDSSFDPCIEGLADCQAQNYSACLPDENSSSGFICQDCEYGLTDTGDGCVVDEHHHPSNKTLVPMDSSDSPSAPYLIPVIVAISCLVIIVVILIVVLMKYRNKMNGTITALKKTQAADDNCNYEEPDNSMTLKGVKDGKGKAGGPRKESAGNVYADLQVYLQPTQQIGDGYTQLRPQSQEVNSLENRPPMMAPTILSVSDGKYDYVSSAAKHQSLQHLSSKKYDYVDNTPKHNSLKPPCSPKPSSKSSPKTSPKPSPKPSPRPSPKPKLKPSPSPLFTLPTRNTAHLDEYDEPQFNKESQPYEEPKDPQYVEPNDIRGSHYEEPKINCAPYMDMEGDINADDYDLVGTGVETYVDMNRASRADLDVDIYETPGSDAYEPMKSDASRASYLSVIP